MRPRDSGSTNYYDIIAPIDDDDVSTISDASSIIVVDSGCKIIPRKLFIFKVDKEASQYVKVHIKLD